MTKGVNSSRRDFLKKSAATTAFALVSGLTSKIYSMEDKPNTRNKNAASKDKPNIIFLMDDQHRYDCLGIVNPLVQTPNLDGLAKRGILFDQAVCQAPMCVPSRHSFMLGLYPSQIGIRMNMDGLTDEQMPTKTIAQILQQAGYQTAGFGKTHWSSKGCSTRGFEVRAIGQPRDSKLYETGAVMMTDENPEGYKAYMEETKSFGSGEERVAGYIGCTSKLKEEDHRDGWVTKKCLEFLDKDVDSSRPLFLYLSYLKPHAGFNVPRGFEELYDINKIPDIKQPPWKEDKPGHVGPEQPLGSLHKRHQLYIDYWSKATEAQRKQMVLRYWANCSWIDNMFGRVLAKLKQKGLLDNCLIVFLADHGEMLGDRFWRFNKYCLYEGSVRVPLIVSGSVVDAKLRGTRDDRAAELVDVMPTILEAAGLKVDARLVGSSLLKPCRRKGAFSEFHASEKAPSYMWRKKDIKLILYVDGKLEQSFDNVIDTKGELYDLKKDPKEWNNLFYDNGYRDIREQMTRELLMHLAAVWTKWPNKA